LLGMGLPGVFSARRGGRPFPGPQATSPLEDLMLAITLVVCVAAQTRLSTLQSHAVPPDPRRGHRPSTGRVSGRWLQPQQSRRSVTSAMAEEFTILLVSAPVFAVVAYLLWVRLAVEPVPEALSGLISPQEQERTAPIWRVVVLVWVTLVVMLLAHALLAYLRRALAGPQESLLYLQ